VRVDAKAPAAKALATVPGRVGKYVSLPFRVSGNGGEVGAVISVYRGTSLLWIRTHEYGGQGVVGLGTYTARWKPRQAGVFKFCVFAVDTAGHQSRESCAPLVVSR
jgi:hypothetical protein